MKKGMIVIMLFIALLVSIILIVWGGGKGFRSQHYKYSCVQIFTVEMKNGEGTELSPKSGNIIKWDGEDGKYKLKGWDDDRTITVTPDLGENLPDIEYDGNDGRWKDKRLKFGCKADDHSGCQWEEPRDVKTSVKQLSERIVNRSNIIIALIVFCILYKITYLINQKTDYIKDYFGIIKPIFVVICLGLYYGFIINNTICWLKLVNIFCYVENVHEKLEKLCFDEDGEGIKTNCLITSDGDGGLLEGAKYSVQCLLFLSSISFTLILLFTFVINIKDV